VFAGVPFGPDEPYNYIEAKRILGLAMSELRRRGNLARELNLQTSPHGRKAITGRDLSYVWDYICFKGTAHQSFWRGPHLTLSIHDSYAFAVLTLPNGMRVRERRRLVELGRDGFACVLQEVGMRLQRCLKDAEGALPWVQVLQRRYPRSRSVPHVDARLEFDLRTALGPGRVQKGTPKRQPQWLEAAFDVLGHKRSNLQFGIGARFPYASCPCIRSRGALDAIAGAWLACKPLVEVFD